MKALYIPALLFPFVSFSQDCNLQKIKDQLTNEPKISTGFFALQGTSLSIDADSKNIDFFFSLDNQAKCFDYESSVIVIYEGGKLKTTFKNSGTVNCEGYFHFTFRNGPSVPYTLTNLSDKKVITLKFNGTNKTVTILDLNPEQQKLLMELTTCMIKEAKTLVH